MDSLYDILPKERVLDRLIDRVSFASDAGFYYLLPAAVVRPVNETEIVSLFRYSHQHRIPLVFRTGGTSLSGQSVTDGLLVDLSAYWKKITVEQNGAMVRVEPGITGAMVNRHLRPYGRKIGPDPSSIGAAMMGGILSNNSSGMCCGTQYNSYHTTRHLRFILPNGNVYDTEEQEDYDRFERQERGLFEGLVFIREEIRENQELHAKIRDKYRMKTTVGYSLNAFLDFEHPLDIFAHLLIGGEGTLAFIARAVLQTIPDPPHKATTLLYFPTIELACEAIGPLTELGAAMVELMDRASLKAVEEEEGVDALIKTLPPGASALLVEFQAAGEPDLHAVVDSFLQQCERFSLLQFPGFTFDDKERNRLWKIRKGLFPSVGAVRRRGTTVILEDIAFPVARLGAAIRDLQLLFAKHRYDDAIIFGHAKDGNIHFVITQSFEPAGEVDRYARFIQDVVDLVVHRYQGTLKAEHGTGRNMAPFVRTEWGEDAYRLMQKLKDLADPDGLLNPGVIINADPKAHLTNLKAMPEVEEEVDKCIECGYCEPVCPSRDFTTSPRRRIVVRRALRQYKSGAHRKAYRELLAQFQFEGIDTCAVDGLCATECPVSINTGELVKRLRRESHSDLANASALFVAKHFGWFTNLIRTLLRLGAWANRLFGRRTMTRLTLPKPPSLAVLRRLQDKPVHDDKESIVYFPSCISRLMGTYPDKPGNSMEAFLSICKKVQVDVTTPVRIRSACCSQIFSSKGYAKAWHYKANEIVENLWDVSRQGMLPVVTDVSS